MTVAAGTKPHPIFLAGRWVESPDVLVVANPADPTDAGRHDLQRDRGAVRGGRRGRGRGVRGHAHAAGLRARPDPARHQRRASARGARSSAGSSRSRPASRSATRWSRSIAPCLTFRLGAEEAERMTGEVIPLDLLPSSKDRVGITRRFPIGPIAGISPFNFPLNLAAHKLAPAIAVRQPDRAQAAVQGPAHDAGRGRDHRGGRCAGRLGLASCR